MKLVSVIIPSYKRPKLLKATINSVVNQTYSAIEIIVIDDNGKGSKYQSETELLINSNFRNSVKYYPLEINKGGSYARNYGFKKSNGDYICFLDNDDECMPTRIEQLVKGLEESDYKIAGDRFITYFKGKMIQKSELLSPGNFLLNFLLLKGQFNGSSFMLSRLLVEEFMGYDEEYSRMQDIEFFTRISSKYDILIINEYLLKINIEDRSNILNTEKIFETKKMFFSKNAEIMNTLTKKTYNEVVRIQYEEVLKVALWNKDIYEYIKYAIKLKIPITKVISLFYISLVKYFKNYR